MFKRFFNYLEERKQAKKKDIEFKKFIRENKELITLLAENSDVI